MIFEGRPTSEITDHEIENLVTEHLRERQHVEFKVTVDLKDDEAKLEVLCDIASLANGGGGYLIIGIRDDGAGKAQKFEPNLVGDTERLRQSIRALCIDHIHERILGLEFDCRKVNDNPVLLIRIPQSDRKPHMVSFSHNTCFITRYDDGKREMRYAEIKEMFNGDLLVRGLSDINARIQSLQNASTEDLERARAQSAVQEGSSTGLLNIRSGIALSEAYRNRFRRHAATKPFFSISAVPDQPSSTLVDLDSPKVAELLAKPPRSRWAGWDMNFEHFPIETSAVGIQRGRDDFRTVELWRNGYVELRAQLDQRFCWGQEEQEFRKQPAINPVPLTEYIVSFLRFYRELLQRVNYQGSALLNLQYLHLKGFRLRPRSLFLEVSRPHAEEDFILADYPLPPGFDPEKTGYDIVRQVFGVFGLSSEEIPAWNREEERFEFEKLK